MNTGSFYYSDHSHSGLVRVDSSVVYLPFAEAQLLCGMGGPTKRASEIHIKYVEGVSQKQGLAKVAALWEQFKRSKESEPHADLLDGVKVQGWKEYRRSFIAAMEKEQLVMTVMFCFVGITTVFIVFVVFYMIVSHKSRDIGILKSIGASGPDIVTMFCGFAFLVGMTGASVGVAGGWLFLAKINAIEQWCFEHYGLQLWDRTLYAIGDIPNRVEPGVLSAIFAAAIVACLLGALIPSWQGARLRPVETLQVGRL